MMRKFLGSVAALALIAALSAPTASFAWRGGGGGGGHWSGGGGGHWSGGGAVHFSGAPAAHFVSPAVRYAGAAPAGAVAWNGGFHRHRVFPGAFAAGAALGAYAAYGGPDYYYGPDYADTYYDNGYYGDGGVVAVVPVAPGGGDPASCAQTYRSYDPASGTYLGYDGLRHPCP